MEVLVALVVLGMLTIVFWRFFSSASRFQSHQSDYMSSMAEVLRVWRYLEDDLKTTSMDYPYEPHQLREKVIRKLQIEDLTSVNEFPEHTRFIDFVALYST